MNPDRLSSDKFISAVEQSPKRATRIITGLIPTLRLPEVIINYHRVCQQAPEPIQPFLVPGIALIVYLESYSIISGRTISDIQKDGTLYPALILYKTVVRQDDIIDSLASKGQTVEVKKQFWESGHLEDIDPREGFRNVISLIDNNSKLAPEQKTYVKRCIAYAYVHYYQAEQELMSSDMEILDIYHIHQLRSQSFGAMAKALTAVLNGSTCLEKEAQEVEDKMSWYVLATEILDGVEDLGEDRDITATLPIALIEYAHNQNKDPQLFIENLLRFYLSQTESPKSSALLLILWKIYPQIKGVLKPLTKVLGNKLGVCNLSLVSLEEQASNIQ